MSRSEGRLTFVKCQLHFFHRVAEAGHSVEALRPEPCRNNQANKLSGECSENIQPSITLGNLENDIKQD